MADIQGLLGRGETKNDPVDALGFRSLAQADPASRISFRNDIPERLAARAESVGASILSLLGKSALLPGEVFKGNIDPNSDEAIKRSFDIASLLGGGGVTAALGRGGSSLGAFGGKIGSAAQRDGRFKPVVAQMNEKQGLFAKRFDVDGLEGQTSISIEKARDGRSINADVEFSFGGVDAATGVPAIGQGAIPTRQSMRALATVMDDVGSFIRDVKPAQVSFVAARPELAHLYRKMADRLAKEFGGRSRRSSENGGFVIELPAPRQFVGQ